MNDYISGHIISTVIRVAKDKLGSKEKIHSIYFLYFFLNEKILLKYNCFTISIFFRFMPPVFQVILAPRLQGKDGGRPLHTVSQRPMMDSLGNCSSGST